MTTTRNALGRADLHCHLLPGVDDGPSKMEQSVELAAAAAADGTTTIAATPHVRGDHVTDVWELPYRVGDPETRLRAEGIDVAVRLGAELGHNMVGRLAQDELDLIALGPPGARWLLVEAPFDGYTEGFAQAAAAGAGWDVACRLVNSAPRRVPERGLPAPLPQAA